MAELLKRKAVLEAEYMASSEAAAFANIQHTGLPVPPGPLVIGVPAGVHAGLLKFIHKYICHKITLYIYIFIILTRLCIQKDEVVFI